MEKDKVTIKEAAKLMGLTKQAIFSAINLKRIKATLNNNAPRPFYEIEFSELDRYEKTKYERRATSLINGQRVFSDSMLTIEDAAKALHRSKNQVYWLIYTGSIESERVGNQYIIRKEVIEKFIKDVDINAREAIGS